MSDTELDDLATTHLQYEVAMLVAQACEFHRRYPRGMPARDQFNEPVTDGALLEATLVHLRLLDDFLVSKQGYPLDVRATDWVSKSQWSPTPGWLKQDIRDRINWQVAHLSRNRDLWFKWDVRGYAYSCCQELKSFVEAIEKHRPDRAHAFTVIERCIADGLDCLKPG